MTTQHGAACDCNLAAYAPVQTTPRGSMFRTPAGERVLVTRTSLRAGWADIDVGPGKWTKRMPHGLPITWRAVAP